MSQATLIFDKSKLYLLNENTGFGHSELPEAFGFFMAGLISLAIWLCIAAIVFLF